MRVQRDGLARARALVRNVPDFPVSGVLFKDLTPMLADPAAFRAVVDGLVATVRTGAEPVGTVVGVEARGFVLAGAVAHAIGAGVVGIRKPGKLPVVADRQTYELEYGSATLEVAGSTLRADDRVLVVDDVLATGGTVEATCHLVERAGATIVATAVVLEVAALDGRARLCWPLHALLRA